MSIQPPSHTKKHRRIALLISIFFHILLLILLLTILFHKDDDLVPLRQAPAPVTLASEEEPITMQIPVELPTHPQPQVAQQQLNVQLPQEETPNRPQDEPPPDEELSEPQAAPEETTPELQEIVPQPETKSPSALSQPKEVPQPVVKPERNPRLKWIKPQSRTPDKKTAIKHADRYERFLTTTAQRTSSENIYAVEYKAARSVESDSFALSVGRALIAATRAYKTTIYSPHAQEYSTRITLIINRDGSLKSVELSPPSAYEDINTAIREVCAMAKFPKIPATIQGSTFTLPLYARMSLTAGFNPVFFTMTQGM